MATQAMTKDNINEQSDAEISYAILSALVESTFADELDLYREDVQDELGLTDENMDRYFDFHKIVKTLAPRKRTYRGRTLKSRERRNRRRDREQDILQFIEKTDHELEERGGEHALEQAKRLEEQRMEHQALRLDNIDNLVAMTPDIHDDLVLKTAFREMATDQATQTDLDLIEIKEAPQIKTKKNKDPAAKDLRKLLRQYGIRFKGAKQANLTIDTSLGNTIFLSGDTEPHRSILRDLGGKWDRTLQVWRFQKKKVRILAQGKELPADSTTEIEEEPDVNSDSDSDAKSD